MNLVRYCRPPIALVAMFFVSGFENVHAESIVDDYKLPGVAGESSPLNDLQHRWLGWNENSSAALGRYTTEDELKPDTPLAPHASHLCEICGIDPGYSGCNPLPDKCALRGQLPPNRH